MKKKTGRIIVGILMGILLFVSGNAKENQKLAQASFQFLSVTSDARAAAMANADRFQCAVLQSCGNV
jgi:hypothetical protein